MPPSYWCSNQRLEQWPCLSQFFPFQILAAFLFVKAKKCDIFYVRSLDLLVLYSLLFLKGTNAVIYGEILDVTNGRSRVASTQITSRSMKQNKIHSEHVCLNQNSSTVQIIHRAPRNLEKIPSKKHKITRSNFKQMGIEKYFTPLASSTLTNRSRVWPVKHFYHLCDILRQSPVLGQSTKLQ